MWFFLFPKSALATNIGQFSAEVWVKPTNSIASQAILGKAEEMRIFTDSSGYAGCQIKVTSWQTAATATTNALTINSWNHVACTYDKANIKVFVNGVQVATQAQTSAPDDTANAILLGQDSSASTPYSNLTGVVDNFQFYNYARSAKQIVEDMLGSPKPVAAGGNAGQGAVGYWKFDEGQGTTANNSGSQGPTLQGTLTSMASPATSTSGWSQSGKFGRGLVFDGTDDYADMGDPSNGSLDFGTSSFSLSAWVKTSSTGYKRIISKGHYGWTDGYLLQLYDSSGFISTGIGAGGTQANSLFFYSGTAVNDGNWHHVISTFDWLTKQARIYIDGKPSTLTKYTGTCGTVSGIYIDFSACTSLTASSTTSFNIGRWSGGSEYWNGQIDEVKIYPYAFTADEVKLDYNRSSSMVLGSLSDNSSYEKNAANQEYCIPGDSTSCTAPVGRWDFEEGSGSTVYDRSGNANNGTWNGTGSPHWTNGKYGKAGNFNGSDDYVQANDATNLDLSSAFTLSAWINPTTTNTQAIIYKGLGCSTWSAYYLAIGDIEGSSPTGTANKINFAFRTANAQAWNLVSQSSTLNTNRWTHAEGTYDGSTLRLYINGVLDNSASTSGSAYNSAEKLYLGQDPGCSGRGKFTGQIDQVRIYNYARSAAQIAWDYNRGAPVGHWKFDECQGSVANDSSGNSNTGTITIGASGTQTAVGTCTGSANTAWKDGATGKFNSSLDFDGTDDYVDLGDLSSTESQSAITWSLWMRPSSLQTLRCLICKFNNGDTQMSWAVENSTDSLGGSDDVIVGIPTSTTDGSTFGYTTSNVLSANTWKHIVAVFDGQQSGNANRLKIYADGVQQTLTFSGTIPATTQATTSNARIGSSSDGARLFPGQIDDVRVYNYALTPLQVRLLYNNGAVNFSPSTGAP